MDTLTAEDRDIIEDNFSVSFDEMDEEKRFEFFQSVVNKYIKESEIYNMNIVIDMYDYLPKDIDRLDNKDKVEAYFLAYPNQSKEEIKYNVIHYAAPTDWIANVNEDYLNQCVDGFYDRNKMLVEECAKYNQTLIDTKGKEDRDITLKSLFDQITKNM